MSAITEDEPTGTLHREIAEYMCRVLDDKWGVRTTIYPREGAGDVNRSAVFAWRGNRLLCTAEDFNAYIETLRGQS